MNKRSIGKLSFLCAQLRVDCLRKSVQLGFLSPSESRAAEEDAGGRSWKETTKWGITRSTVSGFYNHAFPVMNECLDIEKRERRPTQEARSQVPVESGYNRSKVSRTNY